MIYEMRTYILKPGTALEFEQRFAEGLPHREQYSKLGAFWRTAHGTLNQVIHVWPYEDLADRERVRTQAAKDPNWPPQSSDSILSMETEIMTPAPFMKPLGNRELGSIYEMRIYTYSSGSMPEVMRRWSEAIPYREKYSPLAACWYTALGELHRMYHMWPYNSLAERARIRAEAMKDPHWPAPTTQFQVRQENKILLPAAFSPMK